MVCTFASSWLLVLLRNICQSKPSLNSDCAALSIKNSQLMALLRMLSCIAFLRWGLCSLFAWWQDIHRDPYNSARLLRRSGTCGNSCGVSLGINDTSFRKAMHGLEPPLQRLMQKILDSRGGATPLSKLIDGGDACFAGTRSMISHFWLFASLCQCIRLP